MKENTKISLKRNEDVKRRVKTGLLCTELLKSSPRVFHFHFIRSFFHFTFLLQWVNTHLAGSCLATRWGEEKNKIWSFTPISLPPHQLFIRVNLMTIISYDDYSLSTFLITTFRSDDITKWLKRFQQSVCFLSSEMVSLLSPLIY